MQHSIMNESSEFQDVQGGNMKLRMAADFTLLFHVHPVMVQNKCFKYSPYTSLVVTWWVTKKTKT